MKRPVKAAAGLAAALVGDWLNHVQRVARHPLVDPDSPPFTPFAAPMFAGILVACMATLALLTDGAAFAHPEMWLFAAAVVITEYAEIHVLPERQVILNDLFYIVPFVFFPLADAAALVIVSIVADAVLHPRPLLRALARLSSKVQMRVAGLGGVVAAEHLFGLAPGDGLWAVAALVVAGLLAIRLNDYLLFPLTIRVAVGRVFGYRSYLQEQLSLDSVVLAIEVPLTVVAAYAYQTTHMAVLLLVLPYLALWSLARLRPRIARLEEADRVKGQFLSMASHELRTPLTSIQGFASTLRNQWATLDDERKLHFLGVIEEQGERLGRLVDDLLTMSRIEAGTLRTRVEPTQICPLLTRVLEQFPEGTTILRCPVGLQAMADPDQLEQIVINFVSNAVKYGEPPVEVAVDVDEDAVCLRVSDHGPGVPEDFVPRLFDRFTQASGGSNRTSSGAGLGLSIVRALARAQDGDAWYEPNTPRGSTFAVRLPATRS